MKKKSNKSLGRVGISDFLEFVRGSQPEWSQFAVCAPIDSVTKAFAQHEKSKRIMVDAPRKASTATGGVLAPLAAVIQVKGSPWTVVVRSLFTVDASLLEDVPKEARELSRKLKTRAVSFLAEDTSGSMSYEIYDGGQTVESAEWERGGSLLRFKSTARKRPTVEEVGDEFADQVFCKLGVYLPSCYPTFSGNDWLLSVAKKSFTMIARADLIEVPGKSKPNKVQKLLRKMGVIHDGFTWQPTRDWPTHSRLVR